jgi:aspartate racemase
VGILAADGCLRANLYQHALRSAGYRSILLDRASQQILMELVYRIKAGERGNDIGKRVAQLAAVLTRDGAEALIAGCTEIPLVFDQQHTALPLLSSTELLVARVVELAGESELV